VRGCLSFAVFVALLVLAVAWLGLRPLAASLVDVALATAGVRGDGTRVTVDADPPFGLLLGRADRVAVIANDVTFRSLAAGSMALTLTDVGLFDWTARRVTGSLVGVTTRDETGATLAVERIDVSGSLDAADARLLVAPSVVRDRIEAAVADAAIPVSGVRLDPPDGVVVAALGRELRATLAIDSGGNIALSAPILGSVALVALPTGVPLRFGSVTIAADGSLVVEATIDLRPLLAR
jgi:hypothetical protein